MSSTATGGSDAKVATPDFSTLSVYTYSGALRTYSIPVESSRAAFAPLLNLIFGRGEADPGLISLTSSAEGDFVVADAKTEEKLSDASGMGQQADLPSGSQRWNAIYIHESSSEKAGAEISGALSALCDTLANAKVAVLNVCNLTRNFMLVQEHVSGLALDTLREAVQAPTAPEEESGDGGGGPPPAKKPKAASVEEKTTSAAASTKAAADVVRITVTKARVSVGSLTSAQLKQCAHALLQLFFLRESRPTFQHLFELGGEVSLFVDEAGLAQLRCDEPASAEALDLALAPTVVKGWRVLDVTAPSGGDEVGILSAVSLPLADLPLLNVSTFEHSYVLVREDHLAEALRRLRATFVVVVVE